MDGRLGSSFFWAYPNFDPSIGLPGTSAAVAAQQSTVSTTDTFANWHGPMPHAPGTNAQDQASGGSSWPPRLPRPRSGSLVGSAAAPSTPSPFDMSPKWNAREAQVQVNQEMLASRALPPWSLLSQGSSDLLEAHKSPAEFTRSVPEKSLASTGGPSRFHHLRNDILGSEMLRKRTRAGEADAGDAGMNSSDTGVRDLAWRVNDCKKRRDSSGAGDSVGLSTAVSGLSTVTPSTHCAGRTAAEPESELLFREGLRSEGSKNNWATKRQRRVTRRTLVEQAVGGFEKWADESLVGNSKWSRLHSASCSAERPAPAVAVIRKHGVGSSLSPLAGEALSSLSQKESKMAREGCEQHPTGLPDSTGTPGNGLSSWREVGCPGKQAPESILWRIEGREQRRSPSTEEEEEEQEEEESRVRKKPAGKRCASDVLEGLAADEPACCAAAAGPEKSAPHEKGLHFPRSNSFGHAPAEADSAALVVPATTGICIGGASKAASFPSLVMLDSAAPAAGSAEVDARGDCCLEARGASASGFLTGAVPSTSGQAGGAGTAAALLSSGCVSSGNWELWCPAGGWTDKGAGKTQAQHQAQALVQEHAVAPRSMDPGSDDDDFPKFVLSSGRALSAPDRKQKPQTIDDEFEAYFSNLLL